MTSGNASTRVPVLTVRQPWADLIMAGAKDVENRTWRVPSTLPQWLKCEDCADRRRFGEPWPRGETWCHIGTMLHTSVDDGPFPFRLGIHAAAKIDTNAGGMPWVEWRDASGDPPIDTRHLVDHVTLGALLGFVTVTGCHHADECEKTLCVKAEHVNRTPPFHCSRWAEPDTWHWTLTDPQPLRGPIPMTGRPGLWWTDDPSMTAV